MSWILTVGIDKFILTDQEKDFYVDMVRRGEKHIQIKKDMYVSPNYQSLVETNGQNPILNNPNYTELLSLKDKNDDASVRKKMRLEHTIGIQFPYEQFIREWDEVNRTEKSIQKL